jgi:hypothetical protein
MTFGQPSHVRAGQGISRGMLASERLSTAADHAQVSEDGAGSATCGARSSWRVPIEGGFLGSTRRWQWKESRRADPPARGRLAGSPRQGTEAGGSICKNRALSIRDHAWRSHGAFDRVRHFRCPQRGERAATQKAPTASASAPSPGTRSTAGRAPGCRPRRADADRECGDQVRGLCLGRPRPRTWMSGRSNRPRARQRHSGHRSYSNPRYRPTNSRHHGAWVRCTRAMLSRCRSGLPKGSAIA